ncbi:nitroreductase family deazaflavin-dependent oxidoreductase [Nocardiopsis algeriensis]|uniref:Deazaflavin-dependent oxidoreductase (Nitroreductase family) n=1 Tax=Nocardiopsis algeriensis TaxID=1478215 RepID=A0A841IY31_9ACTN|nr:nitroreductase family deazaflavin-dependent oxidoreductase [Nocardiopsis algeriensis]MBB6121138.1 deazaflavin-dependent oxidoreductase (nitroreductase family) [Nocardiopsis algeriensis]
MSFAEPPTSPLSRALFRAPVWIYRAGLGPLMGGRFVLLTHKGRSSGQARQAVLEVLEHDRGTGEVLVASGYGARAQWFRNILREPRVLFQVGGVRHRGHARPLPPQESGQALARYAARHPRSAAALMRALGHRADDSAEAYARIGADTENGTPVVRLVPAGPRRPGTLTT